MQLPRGFEPGVAAQETDRHFSLLTSFFTKSTRAKARLALLGKTATDKKEMSNVACRVHSRTETLVDVRPLLQPGSRRPRRLGPFRAGEVDQVDLGEDALAFVRGIFLVHLVEEATQDKNTAAD